MSSGGLPERRPDQRLISTTRAGSGPAPQSTVFIGRLVIIFGTGASSGLFVYNGTPGPGNPPILAVTTASADPYGNTVTASAITDSGMPLLIYSGPPALGNLIAAIASANGTDSHGNPYLQGTGSYNGSLGTVLNGASIEWFHDVATSQEFGFTGSQALGAAAPALRLGVQTAFMLGWSSNQADSVIWIAPSSDDTGATDYANITDAIGICPNIRLLPGTFYISQTLDWKLAGLKVLGPGPKLTIVLLATSASQNQPIVAVAGEGQDIGGMRLGYAAQQPATNTLAAVWQMGDDTVGDCFMSSFHDMEWFQGAYGTVINPALTASAGFFSCDFSNISIRGYSISAISWDSAAGTGFAACTGSSVENLYVNNNPAGTKQSCTEPAIDIRNFTEIVFNQLNCENGLVNATDWINFQQVGNVVINSLHCEALTLAGSAGSSGMFSIGSDTNLIINGMSVYFCTLNGTVWNPVVRFFGTGSSVTINGYNENSSNGFGGASSLIHQWATFDLPDCVMNVTNVVAEFLISTLANLPGSATGCYVYTQWPETAGGAWQALGAPAAGWTASGVAQYRLLPGGCVMVQIADLVGPAAGPADGTGIWTAATGLPAGFQPAVASRVVCMGAPFTAVAETPGLEFQTDGAIWIYGVNGAANPRLDGTFIISTV